MSGAGPHRRTFLRRLALLAAGGAGYLALRRQLAWPTPKVSFTHGVSSGWIELPEPGGMAALPARIGGAQVRAVIDSGAQYSAIDATLATRLGLPAALPIPLVAFGVSGAPSLAKAVSLDADFGGFQLRGLRAATLDLQPLSSLTRQSFAVLLGRDFLRAVVVEADFPRSRAAVFAPAGWTPPPGAQAVSVRSEARGVMADVVLEGGAPLEVMLDTGATGALALAEEAAQAAGLLQGRPVRDAQSVTLGGVSQDRMVRARSLAFAGHEMTDVDVQIYRRTANSPAPNGLLGLGVLGRFHLALDLPGGRVFLLGPEERRRPARPRPTRLSAV